MSDRLKMPPERDFGFYQRRKHDKWRAVDPPTPALEAPVADSHAHIHMLPDPAWELARCVANGVDYVCMIVDPSEDGSRPFDELNAWRDEAFAMLSLRKEGHFSKISEKMSQSRVFTINQGENAPQNPDFGLFTGRNRGFEPENEPTLLQKPDFVTQNGKNLKNASPERLLDACISVGVHPHNAKLYTPELENELIVRLQDPRVGALGEVGLDFHYDLSPRETQRTVFLRQIELAQQLGFPLVLHLRGGEDPVADNAHREAFEILRDAGALGPRTLLHCCALPPEELEPWIEADCYIAYGGALTFKNADVAREGARLVPEERLLLETDSPYMTPEPMRGAACTPAHVIFTAARLAEVRGIAPGDERKAFLERLHANTLEFYAKANTEGEAV